MSVGAHTHKLLMLTLAVLPVVASCRGSSIAPTPSAQIQATSASTKTEFSFPLKDRTILKVAVAKYGPHGPFEEMGVVRDWESKTNVNIAWNTVPVENRNEKLQLMFASGDLPDVFFGLLSNSDTINYGAQGLIIPLEDLIDQHMPNLKAIFEKRPKLKAALTASDGHIYSFPRVDETEAEEVLSKAYINVDWLKKLGLKMPTTTEEFYAVLKAFKEGDPNGNGKADEIPFTALGSWGPEFSFGLYPMYHAFGVTDTPEHVAVKDGKIVYAPTTSEYRDAMIYWNRLYKEGLADVELFTQSFAQMTAKGRATEPVYGSFVSYLDTVTAGEDWDDVYQVLPPLRGPNGHQSWPRLAGRMYSLNVAQISKANKQPELTAAWIDRFYEPKQSAVNLWGAVGDVLKEDAEGVLRFNHTPAGMNWAEFRHRSTPGGVAPSAILKEHWNTVVEFPQEKKKVTEDIQAFLPYLTRENFPFVFLFSKEEEQSMAKLRTAIETNVEQMTAKWVTSSPPSDAEWNDYLDSMKRMGLDELLAIYQGAYDRYQEAAQKRMLP